MPFMYNIVFNENTQRHELEFVNQQFDYLMGIRFNETTGKYELTCTREEANEKSKFWGRTSFNYEEWMTLAEEELTKADKKKHG